jgi:hypothetical protein
MVVGTRNSKKSIRQNQIFYGKRSRVLVLGVYGSWL